MFVFSANWRQKSKIPLEYGGFAVMGARLAPGQPYGALLYNSVAPKMDVIYSR